MSLSSCSDFVMYISLVNRVVTFPLPDHNTKISGVSFKKRLILKLSLTNLLFAMLNFGRLFCETVTETILQINKMKRLLAYVDGVLPLVVGERCCCDALSFSQNFATESNANLNFSVTFFTVKR